MPCYNFIGTTQNDIDMKVTDNVAYFTIGDYNKMEKLQPQRDAAVPGTSPDVPECNY